MVIPALLFIFFTCATDIAQITKPVTERRITYIVSEAHRWVWFQLQQFQTWFATEVVPFRSLYKSTEAAAFELNWLNCL